MYRILVVEDEDDIQKILENYLIDQGYAVTLAYDGVDGIAKFHNGEFDLVLLDVMMPKIDGFGVCELIRRESNVPIIMLTALDEEAYQIKGFDMNADDYVTKPFSIPILLRKIAAILRRTKREDELQVISYKTLSVDVKGHHVYVCKAEKGEQIEVELTQKDVGELSGNMSLDDIFERFNIDRPEDFRGHSLSVSDIVVLNDGEKVTAHFEIGRAHV